ncbi:hypothetical protein DLM76_11260 [Leptospira yasudae]|nr:hypothetical protein DLM76_11260 [Leptospira yasudae]
MCFHLPPSRFFCTIRIKTELHPFAQRIYAKFAETQNFNKILFLIQFFAFKKIVIELRPQIMEFSLAGK